MFKEKFEPNFDNEGTHLRLVKNDGEEKEIPKEIPDIKNLEEILNNNFFIGFNDFADETRNDLYEKFKNHFSEEDISYSNLIKKIGEDLMSLKLISTEQFKTLTKDLPEASITNSEHSYDNLDASPKKGIEQLILMLPEEQLAGDLTKEDIDKLAIELQELYRNAYKALQNPETEESGEKMFNKLKEKIQLRRYFYYKNQN